MHLGIHTSGGDCAGLYAALRGVAIGKPHKVDPQGSVARTARGLGICPGDN